MLRPTTWDSYRRNIDLHVLPHLGRVPLRHLRPDHLERLYANLLATGHAQRVGGLDTRRFSRATVAGEAVEALHHERTHGILGRG